MDLLIGGNMNIDYLKLKLMTSYSTAIFNGRTYIPIETPVPEFAGQDVIFSCRAIKFSDEADYRNCVPLYLIIWKGLKTPHNNLWDFKLSKPLTVEKLMFSKYLFNDKLDVITLHR